MFPVKNYKVIDISNKDTIISFILYYYVYIGLSLFEL